LFFQPNDGIRSLTWALLKLDNINDDGTLEDEREAKVAVSDVLRLHDITYECLVQHRGLATDYADGHVVESNCRFRRWGAVCAEPAARRLRRLARPDRERYARVLQDDGQVIVWTPRGRPSATRSPSLRVSLIGSLPRRVTVPERREPVSLRNELELLLV
jgi:hypothetical protein